MLKETLDTIDKFDNTITIESITLIKKVGDLEERTIIKFKKAEPTIEYKIEEKPLSTIVEPASLKDINFGIKTSRFNCKEPNESNGPKANTEDDECELNGCFKTTSNPIHKYCSEHMTKAINETCTMKQCLYDDCTEPVDTNKHYCFTHHEQLYPTNIPTDTEKGKELNKTLEPSDTTSSNEIDSNDSNITCSYEACTNKTYKSWSKWCIEHKPKSKKKRYKCKECSIGYNKTTNTGFCSNTCKSNYHYKHDD